MKKSLLVCALLCAALGAYGETRISYEAHWPGLKEVRVYGTLVAIVNPAICSYIRAASPKTRPEWGERIVAFRDQGRDYEIRYVGAGTHGWSDYIYVCEASAEDDPVEAFRDARQLCIPGNGNVYALVPLEGYGALHSYYVIKGILRDGRLEPVRQELYSINEGCTANAELSLYRKANPESGLVGSIPAGSAIDIIGTAYGEGGSGYWYLIRSPLGLIGWHKPSQIAYEHTHGTWTISILDGEWP